MVKKPTEVELTSKKWKLMMLVSVLAVIFAVPTCAVEANAAAGSDPDFKFSSLLFVGGSFGYVFARVGAWWNHG